MKLHLAIALAAALIFATSSAIPELQKRQANVAGCVPNAVPSLCTGEYCAVSPGTYSFCTPFETSCGTLGPVDECGPMHECDGTSCVPTCTDSYDCGGDQTCVAAASAAVYSEYASLSASGTLTFYTGLGTTTKTYSTCATVVYDPNEDTMETPYDDDKDTYWPTPDGEYEEDDDGTRHNRFRKKIPSYYSRNQKPRRVVNKYKPKHKTSSYKPMRSSYTKKSVRKYRPVKKNVYRPKTKSYGRTSSHHRY